MRPGNYLAHLKPHIEIESRERKRACKPVVVQSLFCPILWNSIDCSMLVFPVLHYLLEFIQTHVIESVTPSSVIPFTCLQSFPASWPFRTRWLFALDGQSFGASASASVLPMNIQGWFPLGLTGLISLQSKGCSRVFSSTTVWKYQFFSAQPSLWSNSHIWTWILEKA